MRKTIDPLQLNTDAGKGCFTPSCPLSMTPSPRVRLDYALSVTVLHVFIATFAVSRQIDKLLSLIFVRPSTGYCAVFHFWCPLFICANMLTPRMCEQRVHTVVV